MSVALALASPEPTPCSVPVTHADRPLLRFLRDLRPGPRASFAARGLGIPVHAELWWLRRTDPAVIAALLIAEAQGLGRKTRVPWEYGSKRARVVICDAEGIEGCEMAIRGRSLRLHVGDVEEPQLDAPRLALRRRVADGESVRVPELVLTVSPILTALLDSLGLRRLRSYAVARGLACKDDVRRLDHTQLLALHVLGGPGEAHGRSLIVPAPKAPSFIGAGLVIEAGEVTKWESARQEGWSV